MGHVFSALPLRSLRLGGESNSIQVRVRAQRMYHFSS
jgi:hypothetical protein